MVKFEQQNLHGIKYAPIKLKCNNFVKKTLLGWVGWENCHTMSCDETFGVECKRKYYMLWILISFQLLAKVGLKTSFTVFRCDSSFLFEKRKIYMKQLVKNIVF